MCDVCFIFNKSCLLCNSISISVTKAQVCLLTLNLSKILSVEYNVYIRGNYDCDLTERNRKCLVFI